MSDLILLSELVKILKDKDYYRVFAKTLLMTTTPPSPIPPPEELVNEMFKYFIRDGQLPIIYKESEISSNMIEDEIDHRASEKSDSPESLELAKETERNKIWENEIYIDLQNLKRLYANKCIVFPNSLLRNKTL